MSPSPIGSEGALLLRSAPLVEKLVSGYCALKKGQQQFLSKAIPKNVIKVFMGGIFPNKNRARHLWRPFNRAPLR